MDRPNKITKRNTGTQVVTGIFSPNPSACPSQPHWVTAVSTPYAAHTDSRFIAAALTAMTTERNTTSSSTMDSATTTPISHGSRLPIRFANVTLPAFGPVRYASFGRTSRWSRLTRALVAASCSPVAG